MATIDDAALAAPPVPQQATQDDHTFSSGAKRSELQPAYHLLPPEALERTALRYTMGMDKYGALNYLRGINDPAFVRQVMDHMEAHLHDYKVNGCTKDDNLSAVVWGAFTLMVIEKYNPTILDEAIFGARRKAITDALAQPRGEQPLYVGKAKLDVQQTHKTLQQQIDDARLKALNTQP